LKYRINMEQKMTGTLYLIPSFMGEQSPDVLFPIYNTLIIKKIQYYIVENARTARRSLKHMCPDISIETLHIQEIDKHAQNIPIDSILQPLMLGIDMAIMSEAGMPCIADPGNIFVAKAHAIGASVVPLVGPNSIIMALIASGFNGQQFCFHGYVPIKQGRIQALKHWEQQAIKHSITQICMETPYRNISLLQDMVQVLQPQTKLCIAANITLPNQYIQTKSVGEWKKNMPDIHKQPAIFIIGA